LPERQAAPRWAAAPDQHIGAAPDGTLLHIEGEIQKEFKIGAVFTTAVQAARGSTGDERRNMIRACDFRMKAVIRGAARSALTTSGMLRISAAQSGEENIPKRH